jgi:hypothetical protein
MTASQDLHHWAELNFGGARLGRTDRCERLVRSAAAIAAHPEASFPEIFDWNELRAFYRLCNRPEATLNAVESPHWSATRQAMGQQPLVLILHDTSHLDYSTHHKLEGVGPIGDGQGRGLLQHNSLAVVPAPRRILGLAYQQLRVRKPALPNEMAYQRKLRERESELWPRGIQGAGPAPANSCWVDVADRGGDDYLALQAARTLGHHFLFRVTQNRTVFLSEQRDKTANLLDFARSLPPQGHDVLDIPGRGGRQPRSAHLQLAAAPVWVPPPKGTRQRWQHPLLAAWVIRIWEAKAPATVPEPVEWILLCSLPTLTLADLRERRDWYCCRWLVEMFHDIEKNCCREEARRFETADGMEASLAVLSVVAVRVLQLRCALESQPDAPAEQVATKTEIKVVRQWTKHRRGDMTVREFVRGVARMGGFLGRKGDGEPGIRTLWRGCQRLQDLVLGFQLHDMPHVDSS